MKKKSEGDRARPDRHKTGRRSGAFCRTAEMAYDPEGLIAGAGQLRKAETASKGRNKPKGDGHIEKNERGKL